MVWAPQEFFPWLPLCAFLYFLYQLTRTAWKVPCVHSCMREMKRCSILISENLIQRQTQCGDCYRCGGGILFYWTRTSYLFAHSTDNYDRLCVLQVHCTQAATVYLNFSRKNWISNKKTTIALNSTVHDNGLNVFAFSRPWLMTYIIIIE